MSKIVKQKLPIWYWIIAAFALLWNALGIYKYLQHAYQTEAFKALYPDLETLTMVINTPDWVMAAFATAVFFGFLGSVALLLRTKWAKPLLLISLIGITIQLTYNLFISNALEVYGPGAIIMPMMVLVFGFVIFYLAKKAESKGWIL
ncbi:hypothetical protein ES676_05100 [Bizionia saleffrena]|uniref:Sugar transporter n=1 Tax=Bizionia saleffrena TaxID=291189 RepID=A0A8H2QM54_9FLAO|nr:hypothetical protein [Bizionia saleffrena]TYB76722.1 hypothetical protein ES676_05100 [Bizionia saleffrena]